jgi:hypothetical protein
MTDNPHPRAEKVAAIPISDAPHADFIYFENAPAFGFGNGESPYRQTEPTLGRMGLL